MIVGSIVAHHSDRPHRKKHGESLPDCVIKPRTADFIEVNGVGLPQDFAFLVSHFARDADRESGSWKRMAADKSVRKSEFTPQLSHLVLEQFTKRFDELHVHSLGQPADIVVALDRN